MDPNANLAEQLDSAKAILAAEDLDSDALTDITRLSELVIALDDWIKKGGFLPTDWNFKSGG